MSVQVGDTEPVFISIRLDEIVLMGYRNFRVEVG